MRLIIRPVYPTPKNYPANLLPKLEAAIGVALKGPVNTRIKKEMQKRVRNWVSAPSMATKHRITKNQQTLRVYPSGTKHQVDKWRWVSQGTQMRVQVPVRAPILRFQQYNPHTKNVNQYALPRGGTRSGNFVKRHRTENRIEGREFERHVVEQVRQAVGRDIQAAVNAAFRGK